MVSELLSNSQVVRERQRYEQLRRWIFIVAGSLGVVIITIETFGMILFEASLRFYPLFLINNVLFGLFALTVVILAVTRRVAQEQLDKITLGVFAIESLVFNGIVPGLADRSLETLYSDTIGDDIWFLLIICLMVLHLFPLRRALWLVIAMYGASFLIVLWRSWRGIQSADPNIVLEILRMYIFGAVIIAIAYLLVRYRDNLREIRDQHEILQDLAFVDPLTRLSNRRHTGQLLAEQIDVWNRYAQPFCVLIMDIDHFKQVNDRFGHGVGDDVLVRVAHLLRESLRTTDVVGRWGGEEFLVVMRMTTIGEAQLVAERICQLVAQSQIIAGWQVTLSIGVAECLPPDTSDTILQRADRALYAAKAAGRNQVQLAVTPVA